MNNVINSKLFTGIATGSILTTLFAEHPIGLITASTGVAIEIGQLTLEFKKQKYELQNLLKDNPASFIGQVLLLFKTLRKNDVADKPSNLKNTYIQVPKTHLP